MSRIDVLVEEQRTARNRLRIALVDLCEMGRAAIVDVDQGRAVSAHALMVKAQAVDEAARILAATRAAVDRVVDGLAGAALVMRDDL